MTLVYDRPEFSPAELEEIRRLAAEKHAQIHQVKNETAVRTHRDLLTERLQTLESIQEKAR